MKIFDFNIHLPDALCDDVNVVIDQDLSLDLASISRGLNVHKKHFNNINQANILLFNTSLLDHDITILDQEFKGVFEKCYMTNLIDFRRTDIEEYIRRAKDSGISAVMFNSYLQKIANKDFESVLKVCRIAEQLQLIVCIDGSYGTSKMYEYKNMQLACYIADNITKTKIVIVHSGGYNIIPAMLLALDKKNVWLDTSFSLSYYLNSSVEIDFAFAYRKMDYKRIVFGSDHPYIRLEQAISDHQGFFERHKFPSSAVEDIFFNNACSLFDAL